MYRNTARVLSRNGSHRWEFSASELAEIADPVVADDRASLGCAIWCSSALVFLLYHCISSQDKLQLILSPCCTNAMKYLPPKKWGETPCVQYAPEWWLSCQNTRSKMSKSWRVIFSTCQQDQYNSSTFVIPSGNGSSSALNGLLHVTKEEKLYHFPPKSLPSSKPYSHTPLLFGALLSATHWCSPPRDRKRVSSKCLSPTWEFPLHGVTSVRD